MEDIDHEWNQLAGYWLLPFNRGFGDLSDIQSSESTKIKPWMEK